MMHSMLDVVDNSSSNPEPTLCHSEVSCECWTPPSSANKKDMCAGLFAVSEMILRHFDRKGYIAYMPKDEWKTKYEWTDLL